MGSRRAGALATAALALVSLVAPPRVAQAADAGIRGGPPTSATPTPRSTVAGGGAARGTVPESVVDRYLERRPPLGAVTVVDVGSESNDRKLLAATLQGLVNRTTARLYLRGARSVGEDQRWLDSYVDRGLITIAATIDLDTAIHDFAGEADGYVLADAAEPWTVNTATSVAGIRSAVVATPDTVAALQAEGLTELADHRGRWTSAAAAYEAIAAAHPGEFSGVAIEQPDRHQPRDLFVQQGTFVVYTRPSASDYDRIYDLIETFPATRPVYGYISDTGAEEIEAIVRLSRTGRYLVPTDSTDNISLHLAVGGTTRALPDPTPPAVEPCRADTVNVVLSFSDGDNLVIPETYYQGSSQWNSSRRGELPIGWGLSPAASVLMPAIYDTYVTEATASDEIVDIMGAGYSIPSLMPDGASFVAKNQRFRAALGLRSHWALDALLSKPDAEGWTDVHAATAATGLPPDGMLLNYESWPGPGWFHTVDGTPVLASRIAGYENGPADIAAQIAALADVPASERSLVNFFPVTVWYSTYDALADAMAPLRDQGVRFLTPAEAFACLPKAPAPPTTTTTTSPATPTTTSSTPTTGPASPPAAAVPLPGTATYTG